MRQGHILFLSAVVLVFMQRVSHGGLLPCHEFTTDNLFPPKTTVDIWILNAPVGSLVSPMTATGLSASDVKLAVERAAEVWNEESGSSLRLRVQGMTTTTPISQAIVITGELKTCTNGLAVTYEDASGSDPNHRFVNSTIEIRQHATGPGCSNPIPWCLTPNTNSCVDLVGALIHELGHGAYNLNHPDSGAADCTYEPPESSVMFSILYPYRDRTLKEWDLELAQSRYTPRSNSASLWRDQLSGASTWKAGGVVAPGSPPLNPLVRPGSMPANVNQRFFGWTAGTSTANDGGTGYVDAAEYQAGISDRYDYGGWSAGLGGRGLTRPVASAGYANGANTPTILVYEEYLSPQPPQYTPATDEGRICYWRSMNANPIIGSETCSSVTTAYFGLTATYDPYSNTYLIGYVADDSLDIGVLEVPSLTNTTTPVTATVLPVSTYHAPSIACSGAIGGCKIVYEAANNNGSLSWLNVGVSGSTGAVTINSSYASAYITEDTPSVVYWANDVSFRIAYTIDNYAVYTFKLTGNTLSGTGDAFYDFDSYISSPVLNPRVFSTSSKLYTWLVKYW